MSNMSLFFSRLIGTLAVTLLLAGCIGGSSLFEKFFGEHRRYKDVILAGILGGLFGIYGNISGVTMSGGAIVSVRDIGPMLAGFIGGPLAGLLAGLIAGVHRLIIGGITAKACTVATCCIGFVCGLISKKRHAILLNPLWALLIGAGMELFHLSIVLVLVKPFETAFSIVKQMIIPFVLVNAAGFAMMIAIMSYIGKQKAIALDRSRLQSELEVATVIQQSLLPQICEEYPGRKEIDVNASMEPAREVGGDFYDVFFVENNKIAFAVGDVSGKGVPAALFMATAKTTLQNCVRDLPTLSAAVEAANFALCRRNEAEMFVTLWIGVLDVETGKINYVSAGHNPPVVFSGGRAQYIKTKNSFVLAGMDGVKYKEYEMQIKKGDTLLIYTDGVVEAETEAHELYGEERLLECFKELDGADSETIIKTVKESVDAFVNGNDQFDDLTMLCFKYI
ncbi:MAG: SpoIIE family protein phosphatase [Clostridia bacterium]|nr:SpoIIE family protein phosphatase [Clostridia bacterium]